MVRSDESVLELNMAEFLAEYFTGSTSAKDQFSYGPFWDAVVAGNYNGERINIFIGNKQKHDGSFYYEYGLLKAENEVMNLAAEMREITQQKPILCLESHKRLFRGALDSILEAYSKGEYSNEDLRREHCPDVTEVYTDWMRYKFRCSNEYEAYMLMVGDVEGNNVCNAIDAAWTWFHTGFVNNFISKDPETNLLHLNW